MAKNIVVGSQIIGADNPCMIVAEISANHLQNKYLALKLIEEAKRCGATAVKFQAYTPDTITLDPASVSEKNKQHFMIRESIWQGRSFFDLYQEAYTPWEWFPELKQRAKEHDLGFIVSPFDETAVDYLEKVGVDAYKIASFEINHIPLIKKVAKTNKPVIFSTGVAEPEDIHLALDTLKENGNNQIIILKCTSSYPAPIEDANLITIRDMQDKFKILTGLSDHTVNAIIPAYAVAMGACMVEKHFTLEKKGPDAAFSLLPHEFAEMAKNIRECESAMGKINYELTTKVKQHRAFMRSIFASADIKSGEPFTTDNIRIVRPGLGLHPKHFENLLGKKTTCDIQTGEPINDKMVE